MRNNIWILTEERPKISVLQNIFMIFARENGCGFFDNNIRIIPLLNNQNKFIFIYEVVGFICSKVDRVFIKVVSGSSSFVDYLIFHQNSEPNINDIPILAVEETKTDDSESRNTGIFQRCSKFVYFRYFYPKVKMVMLYNLQVAQKDTPTDSYTFGAKLLATFGVEIFGKNINDNNLLEPFNNIEEIIDFKQKMKLPPKGNIPVLINKVDNQKITISGRLFKGNGLGHDPNIGQLSLISAVLRQLGWEGIIEIIEHGLVQKHLTTRNKFIKIANIVNITFKNLVCPNVVYKPYWHYETNGEKLGTIFIHIVVENFTEGFSIFENHAGCEKGYFIKADGTPIALAKYSDRDVYKSGDKKAIINIPDLILIDFGRSEIINIEGKKYKFRNSGIDELNNYDYIEKEYISKHYPDFKILRTVVLYGSKEVKIIEIEIGFMLNENGNLVLGVVAPQIFKEAINNLLEFWAN